MYLNKILPLSHVNWIYATWSKEKKSFKQKNLLKLEQLLRWANNCWSINLLQFNFTTLFLHRWEASWSGFAFLFCAESFSPRILKVKISHFSSMSIGRTFLYTIGRFLFTVLFWDLLRSPKAIKPSRLKST